MEETEGRSCPFARHGHSPDPRPAVRLRLALEARRARGEDFLLAWPAARAEALKGLRGQNRADWLEVWSAPEVRLAFYNGYSCWAEPMPLVSLVAAGA